MIHDIKSILVEEGYEILDVDEENGIIKVKDLDCGVVITCVLEDNIFFLSVACSIISDADITRELAIIMLDSNNGISTSFFNLYNRNDGTRIITLNNFCKLLELGDDDKDDILSCLNFLSADLLAAKNLLEKFN